MENNILKIDLDIPRKDIALKKIRNRLAYMHDLGFFKFDAIKSITLLKKSSYCCKIVLKEDLSPEFIIIFQLLLGSDYQKEVNTLLNHFMLNMEYSNRLFTVKRYKGNKLKTALEIDITSPIKRFIYNKRRKTNYN